MNYGLLNSLEQSMTNLWIGIVSFLPQVVIAILIIIVGWIIGGIVSGIVQKLFKMFRLDTALDKAGVDDLSRKAGYNFAPAKFTGSLVKWFIILAFTVVALDVLGLQQVTVFMREVVLGYLPKVLAALLILFAGVIVASMAKGAIVAFLRATSVKRVEWFGSVAYYLVIAFSVMAALNQLEIAAELVQILFAGVVFALALAFALAFGLGGRDAAKQYIDRMMAGR